jgi:hypothetical protein
MRFKEILIITKGTKVILMITFSVAISAVLFAFFYYRGINNSGDPRIAKAREYLMHYENESGRINSFGLFSYLDSAYAIFRSFPDYETSYEIGLIYNNKCSALLLTAIYDSTVHEAERNNLLNLSLKFCDSSITNYQNWMKEWESLTPELISARIDPFMKKENPAFRGNNFKRIFKRRVENIVTAQLETPRRLSVSLTNKGTIYRHKMKTDSALIFYQMALALWKDNRTAKSNMNVLLGGEPVKPSLIESLFPPDKNKK